MKEFTIGEIRTNVASVFDQAAKEPIRVLTLRANGGTRREPVVMLSEKEYLRLLKKTKGR